MATGVFSKGLWVTVFDIHGIWTRCPTHNHHGLYKQTHFRTSRLRQKQVLFSVKYVGVSKQSASQKIVFLCVSVNCTIVGPKQVCGCFRSVGVGSPPGGPGREAEEFASSGSAYGTHTIPHRQRQGEVFNVKIHLSYTQIS